MGGFDFGLGLKIEESFGLLQLQPKFTETVFTTTFFLEVDILVKEWGNLEGEELGRI